jgi:hypothetical protein
MTTKLTPSSTGVVQKETPGFPKKNICQTYSKVPRSTGGDLHFDLELPQRHQKDFIPFIPDLLDALDKGPAFVDPKMAVAQGANRNIPFLKPDFW